MKIEVIAEAGVAHGGSLQAALDLVEAAKRAGADIVKFQTYIPELLVRRTHRDYELLCKLALSFEQFEAVSEHCDAVGIEFLSTPGDLRSLDFLVRTLGVNRIKIGSDDFMNWPLVEAAVQTGLPVLASTGMVDDHDIHEFVFKVMKHPSEVTLMQCTSLYPCPPELVNLGVIRSLKRWSQRIGYSDHTDGTRACIMAAAAGACIVEKHIMLTAVESVDEAVSVYPYAFEEMVGEIRLLEVMMGDGSKRKTAIERDVKRRLLKRSDGPFRPAGEGDEVAGGDNGARGKQAHPE